MPGLLKTLKEEVKKLGPAFKAIWINPGYCRWINKMPPQGKYFSGIDVLKTNVRNLPLAETRRKARGAKARVVVVGALTLPLGLPVMLVTLPVLFFYKGLPFLRTRHLNKMKDLVQLPPFNLCAGKCARNVAKLLTGIGHPKLEVICESCRAKVEGVAQEAGELIQDGEVETDDNAITDVLESREDSWDEQSDVGD
jgi:hypothetical protein